MVNPSVDDSPLTSEEMDAALAARFPEVFTRKQHNHLPAEAVVLDWGYLDERHVAALKEHIESGESLGVRTPDIKSIRYTHHRLAQLLAGGMNETVAARLCNLNPQRISHLKHSPAFAELLAHYASVQEEAFAEFVETASALNMDMLGRLQEILDEEPEKITASVAIEAIKLLSDRTGHAPVQKSISNVNVNIGMGERLRAARERAAQAERLRITSVEDT